MTPEQRKFRSQAGRDLLAGSLLGVKRATQHLELTAQSGTSAQLMEAMELREKAVEQVREAKTTCVELLGAEVKAWIEGV